MALVGTRVLVAIRWATAVTKKTGTQKIARAGACADNKKETKKKQTKPTERERERERQISVPDTDNNKRCRLGFKLFGLLDLRKERERERSTKPDKRYA